MYNNEFKLNEKIKEQLAFDYVIRSTQEYPEIHHSQNQGIKDLKQNIKNNDIARNSCNI